MEDFSDKVGRYIFRHNLLKIDGGLVLVALSGGADSVALLAVLTDLGYRCKALHCNFHLRGEESNRDCHHACAIASRLGVEIAVKDFDVEQYCVDSLSNLSVEMACRELRYRWFADMFIRENAQAVAVAHSVDDNIETLFLNLIRGTGIRGMKGMLPQNYDGIVRPFLCVTRVEIEDYLKSRSLDFIVDSTNLDNIYKRNLLRNEVLPTLYAAFPYAKKGITSSLMYLVENAGLYDYFVKERLQQYIVEDGIDLKSLVDNELYPELLLFEWLKPKGVSRLISDDILVNAKSSGKHFDVGDSHYIIDRGVLKELVPGDRSILFEDIFKYEVYPIADFKPQRDPKKAYFDVKVLDGDDLMVRYWQNGDSMIPFGMRTRKKLSDIFINAKIGIDKKSRIPLLIKGNEIIWIGGVRQSDKFKIDKHTSHYIEITLR